jgi:hypothetical protein
LDGHFGGCISFLMRMVPFPRDQTTSIQVVSLLRLLSVNHMEKFAMKRDLTHSESCRRLPGGDLLTKGTILNRDGEGRAFHAFQARANPVTSDEMAPRRSSSHEIGDAFLACKARRAGSIWINTQGIMPRGGR